MPPLRKRRRRHQASTATRLVELGLAAPEVAIRRLGRMALAGPMPSARDRREFSGMALEKQVVFAQSWLAMCEEAWRQQLQFALSLMVGLPATWRHATLAPAAFDRIATRGLAPIHRKAVANAKRLRAKR